MNYMVEGAFVRFFRTVGGTALGAGVAAAVEYQPVLETDLSTTEFGIIAVLFGGAVTAFDKYARERGWYGTAQ